MRAWKIDEVMKLEAKLAGRSGIAGNNQSAPCVGKIVKNDLLTHEEEARLCYAWLDHGDVDARNRLVESYQPLALRIVSDALKKVDASRRHELKGDLMGEATKAIIHAADKFDPGRGYRFSTYAQWWIKSFIKDFLVAGHSLVKLSTSGNRRKLFFQLRPVMAAIEQKAARSGKTLTSNELIAAAAEALGIPLDVAMEVAPHILGGDWSLNALVGNEDGDGDEWVERLACKAPTPEEAMVEGDTSLRIQELVRESLWGLNERELYIIEKRKLDPEGGVTLDELAQHFGVSPERVRQIELGAMTKIERFLKRNSITLRRLLH